MESFPFCVREVPSQTQMELRIYFLRGRFSTFEGPVFHHLKSLCLDSQAETGFESLASGLEESMPAYEVLILDKDANPAAFIETQQADDDDAIRSAARIANGRPFEVWRDIVCVHRVRPELTGRAA
jgi:hypothetical protein